MRLSVLFTWIFVAAVTVGMVTVIIQLVGLVTTRLGLFDAVMPVSFILAGCSLMCVFASWVQETGHLKWLMTSSCIAAGLAFVGWSALVAMSTGTISNDAALLVAQLNSLPTIWVVFATFTGLLALARVDWPLRCVPVLTFILLAGLAVVIAFWIWFGGWVEKHWQWQAARNFHESMAKVSGILGVLTAAGLISTLVVAQLRRLSGHELVQESERLTFTITCPRCETQQTMQTHGDSCKTCGLRARVVPQ